MQPNFETIGLLLDFAIHGNRRNRNLKTEKRVSALVVIPYPKRFFGYGISTRRKNAKSIRKRG